MRSICQTCSSHRQTSSGPSQTYPQRAYRNPLDRLVAFLDAKHGDQWAIWEFRAEGTGYPDEAVYGRIRHYPWPDHHPPPFRMVPMIVASMRNWLHGEDDKSRAVPGTGPDPDKHTLGDGTTEDKKGADDENNTKSLGDKVKAALSGPGPKKRVVVVHCKAGKGRSGTMACSYLISQCGWTAEDALARFTSRRMRPKFGSGVSIPSQLRWVSYVDRWTRAGKQYVDREVEVVEVHVWGLRHGVKVCVEGFADEGKKIKTVHTFKKTERLVVQGDAPDSGGVMQFLGDAFSPPGVEEEVEDADYEGIVDADEERGNQNKTAGADSSSSNASKSSSPARSQSKKNSKASSLLRNTSVNKLVSKSKTINPSDFGHSTSTADNTSAAASHHSLPDGPNNPNIPQPAFTRTSTVASLSEPGGMAVIFRPSAPIRLPTSDICVSLERRNRAPASMGLTMVTAVAHVWFNAFFEGNGPEQGNKPNDSGVFEIEWDKMDGLKGSSRKGTKAADRISIVWRVAGAAADGKGGEGTTAAQPGLVVTEPGEGSPVPQMRPADWRGEGFEDPDKGKRLGLRAEDPSSASVSRASSVKSGVSGKEPGSGAGSDDESLKGVKSAMAGGEEGEGLSKPGRGRVETASDTDQEDRGAGSARALSEHEKKIEATKGRTEDPNEASGAARSHQELAEMTEAGPGDELTGLRGGGAGDEGGHAAPGSSTLSPGGSPDVGGAQEQRVGDTTHLGFVRRGKKLLPLNKHAEDAVASSPASVESASAPAGSVPQGESGGVSGGIQAEEHDQR